jgi:hypothetical protein
MTTGVRLVNNTEAQIVIFGVKFTPGKPTFISEDLLRKSETSYYLSKGILTPYENTRVAASEEVKESPKVKESPVKEEPKTESSKEEVKKPRRRRRTRKPAANKKE